MQTFSFETTGNTKIKTHKQKLPKEKLKMSFFVTLVSIAVMIVVAVPAGSTSAFELTTPLSEKNITVTICDDPLCRFHCRNETKMQQDQCRNEHGGSQKAICAQPPGPGSFCVQQTIFENGGGPAPNSGSSSDNGTFLQNQLKDGPPSCDPHRALSTAPRQCDKCIANHEHAHGHPELEFIKITDCNSDKGTFTVHTSCTPDCLFCNSKITVDPKTCYPNAERGFDMQFGHAEPCPGRLIVKDYWGENCTGWPHPQTTFQNSCYTQTHGRHQYSLRYQCE